MSLILRLALVFAAGTAVVKAESQLSLAERACAEYQQAEAQLESVYQQVLQLHRGDDLFSEKMRAAQQAWLAFREAQIEAIYPAEQKQFEYGSVYPMCNCIERTQLTRERTQQLSQWLDSPMGDVCSGSR